MQHKKNAQGPMSKSGNVTEYKVNVKKRENPLYFYMPVTNNWKKSNLNSIQKITNLGIHPPNYGHMDRQSISGSGGKRGRCKRPLWTIFTPFLQI